MPISKDMGFCKTCKSGFAYVHSNANNKDFCCKDCENEYDRKTKTIMQRIKEYCDCIPFTVEEYGIVQHPLFDSFGTLDLDTNKLIVVTDKNIKRLKKQRYSHIEKCLKKNDTYLTGVFRYVNKPYHIPIFMLFADQLSKEQYTKILISLWTRTEFPNQNGKQTMIELFDKAEKKYLMDKDEKKVFDTLPETIKVYRGLQTGAIKTGLSWTITKKIAIWFADRFNNHGTLLEARIDKKWVYAFKNGRNEDEIILNSNHLKEMKEVIYPLKTA